MAGVVMQPVSSSNIDAVGHDPETDTLHVKFKNGGLYHYHGVDSEKFAALTGADSIGKHLNDHIKGKHDHTKVEGGASKP